MTRVIRRGHRGASRLLKQTHTLSGDHNAGSAEWHSYYSAGVGQSRDSDCLEQSNFAAMLASLGGESETVLVVRESHWAVGWVEWIAIHEADEKALAIADAQCERLAISAPPTGSISP